MEKEPEETKEKETKEDPMEQELLRMKGKCGRYKGDSKGNHRFQKSGSTMRLDVNVVKAALSRKGIYGGVYSSPASGLHPGKWYLDGSDSGDLKFVKWVQKQGRRFCYHIDGGYQ